MARSARWYLQRLRAMSPAEVAHRAKRVAWHPFERARMKLARFARLPRHLHDWRGPTIFYFGDENRPLTESVRAYAQHLLSGKRRVLGLGWVDLPRSPWHLEPSRGVYWPRMDAARVLSATDGLDARMTWEINRGHDWVILARVWQATRDERFKRRLLDELSSWRTENPVGVGINWASAMEAAIRLHSLAWVAAFLRGESLIGIAEMLHTHSVFVSRNLSRHSSANNHLIVELSALAVAQRVTSGREPSEVIQQLMNELRHQIFTDGVNAEMATHYHEFVMEALHLVATLERKHGNPCLVLEEVISRMGVFTDALTYREGLLLHHGDNDDGKIIALLALEPEWLPAIERRPARSVVFQDSGQVVFRSDRLVASFDAGPHGFGSLAAHAHCDALAVNAALDEEAILVDRGTSRYNGDPTTRHYFRSTAAHNTLQVGNAEQATSAGPFLWTRRPRVRLIETHLAGERDIATAEHDGFGDIIHRRRVARVRDVLIIRDEISARATVSIRYHVAPSVCIGGDSPFAQLMLFGKGIVRVVKMRHSNAYGTSETANTIQVDATLDAGDYVLAVLTPRGALDHAVLYEVGAVPELATFDLARASATAPTANNTQNSTDI